MTSSHDLQHAEWAGQPEASKALSSRHGCVKHWSFKKLQRIVSERVDHIVPRKTFKSIVVALECPLTLCGVVYQFMDTAVRHTFALYRQIMNFCA